MKIIYNQLNTAVLPSEELEWAPESIYYSSAEIPSVISVFENAKVQLCKFGLEKICAVSSGVVSG